MNPALLEPDDAVEGADLGSPCETRISLSRVSARLARRLDENANVGEALIGRSMADTRS